MRACIALVFAVALLAAAGTATASASSVFKLPSCRDPSPGLDLHVSGNRVLTLHNKPFSFYGVSTYGGLQNQYGSTLWKHALASAVAQIKATPHWHANTIRIQIAEQNLFLDTTPSQPVNVAVLNALCSEVQLARREGLEVVINDQTEWPNWYEQDPTSRTVQFWKYVGAIYANEPGITFDLFNEPRVQRPNPLPTGAPPTPLDLPWVWKVWRNGGIADGTNYVGMQTMVNLIRDRHWHNLIWVEGPLFDDAVKRYKQYAVTGSNLVISFHHPALDTGVNGWKSSFGFLAAKYPMVDGEWSEYAGVKPECNPEAPTLAPQFLAYLKSINMGLIAWSLQAGALTYDPNGYVPTNLTQARDTTNPAALFRPDSLDSSFACTSQGAGEGIGELVYNDFKGYANGG